MLNNMIESIRRAAVSNYTLGGFNVFGYEDAIAVVKAAEALNAPVILLTNKLAIEHMPVEYWGMLLGAIARDSKVLVGVHLDHCNDYNLIKRAIKSGYTSVMYDGSQLPLEQNIQNTKQIVKMAHDFGVAVEGEIGSVPYTDFPGKVKDIYTDPQEAKVFVEETGVDWLAVAIGTVHRMQVQEAQIQYDRLEAIQRMTNVPLVIHGSTGIADEDLAKLNDFQIGKINIGTALRIAFVNTLRKEINENPKEFDRLNLFKKPMGAVQKETWKKMELLGLKRAFAFKEEGV